MGFDNVDDEFEDLHDDTRVEGERWENLKFSAMQDDYKKKDWYTALNDDEKSLLEELRAAQKKQGNMKALNPRPEDAKASNQININDSTVKDRWSRYIGAMGIEAVAKQAEATILISGLGGVGVEIAKNLVLAGCKELILHDS